MRRWRGLLTFAVIVAMGGGLAGTARAEDEPKPEDLKRMYQETLNQLKAAQDRKSELSGENERLNGRIADLERQLAAVKAENSDLKHQAAAFADRTFFLRSHYAAWDQFLSLYPALRAQWETFIQRAALPLPREADALYDPQWPLSARG